jgi:DNA primase
MVDLLWRRETEGKVFDSPERKATLDKSLRAAIKRITDPSIRAHYGEEIKRLRWDLFGNARRRDGAQQSAGGAAAWRGSRAGGRQAWPLQSLQPLPATKSTLLAATGNTAVAEYLREAMILAICVAHPALIADFESQLDAIHLTDPDHERLRHLMLMHGHEPATTIHERILAGAGAELEKLMSLPHVRIAPPVKNADDADLARMCLAEELAKLDAHRAVRAEIEDAMEDLSGLADEGVTWRLNQAATACHRAQRSRLDDNTDMGEDRAALSAQLQALIDAEVWRKKKP